MSIHDAQEYHQNMVHYLRATVAYTDDGSAVSLGWIPADAVVLDAGVVVTTAFNAGTNNQLDIGFRNAGDGTADDTDEFAGLIALGTAGAIGADNMATAADLLFPSGAEIVATVTLSGTAATAGSGVVWVKYLTDNS